MTLMSAEVWEGLSPPYGTIVADPPWHYDTTSPPRPRTAAPAGETTRAWSVGQQAHQGGHALPYRSLSLEAIKALPVGRLASDTRCFLWTTNRYLFDAPDVLRAWGFQPQTRVFVWCKPPMGTMNVTTEFVVVGRKGHPPRLPWHGTTWFEWPRSGGHSVKPAAFGDLVESWSPGPYVELFARQPRLGWDSWGHGYEQAVSR